MIMGTFCPDWVTPAIASTALDEADACDVVRCAGRRRRCRRGRLRSRGRRSMGESGFSAVRSGVALGGGFAGPIAAIGDRHVDCATALGSRELMGSDQTMSYSSWRVRAI